MNLNDLNGLAVMAARMCRVVSDPVTLTQELVMDKDRVAGSVKRTKGSVKEAIGKVTGNGKTQAEGAVEKNAGQTQNAVGGVKDAVREATKPRRPR